MSSYDTVLPPIKDIDASMQLREQSAESIGKLPNDVFRFPSSPGAVATATPPPAAPTGAAQPPLPMVGMSPMGRGAPLQMPFGGFGGAHSPMHGGPQGMMVPHGAFGTPTGGLPSPSVLAMPPGASPAQQQKQGDYLATPAASASAVQTPKSARPPKAARPSLTPSSAAGSASRKRYGDAMADSGAVSPSPTPARSFSKSPGTPSTIAPAPASARKHTPAGALAPISAAASPIGAGARRPTATPLMSAPLKGVTQQPVSPGVPSPMGTPMLGVMPPAGSASPQQPQPQAMYGSPGMQQQQQQQQQHKLGSQESMDDIAALRGVDYEHINKTYQLLNVGGSAPTSMAFNETMHAQASPAAQPTQPPQPSVTASPAAAAASAAASPANSTAPFVPPFGVIPVALRGEFGDSAAALAASAPPSDEDDIPASSFRVPRPIANVRTASEEAPAASGPNRYNKLSAGDWLSASTTLTALPRKRLRFLPDRSDLSSDEGELDDDEYADVYGAVNVTEAVHLPEDVTLVNLMAPTLQPLRSAQLDMLSRQSMSMIERENEWRQLLNQLSAVLTNDYRPLQHAPVTEELPEELVQSTRRVLAESISRSVDFLDTSIDIRGIAHRAQTNARELARVLRHKQPVRPAKPQRERRTGEPSLTAIVAPASPKPGAQKEKRRSNANASRRVVT